MADKGPAPRTISATQRNERTFQRVNVREQCVFWQTMECPARPIIPAISPVLACVSCVGAPPPEPIISEVATKASPDNPACHGYTAQAVIDGKLQPIVGRACQQPDGTWIIVEGPPDRPDRYTTVYVPPPYADSPYVDPWLWTAPIGLSVGAFIFVDHDHHFHDGHRFAHFGHMHRFEGRHGFGHTGGGGRLG